jgi:hypothetical protein
MENQINSEQKRPQKLHHSGLEKVFRNWNLISSAFGGTEPHKGRKFSVLTNPRNRIYKIKPGKKDVAFVGVSH